MLRVVSRLRLFGLEGIICGCRRKPERKRQHGRIPSKCAPRFRMVDDKSRDAVRHTVGELFDP